MGLARRLGGGGWGGGGGGPRASRGRLCRRRAGSSILRLWLWLSVLRRLRLRLWISVLHLWIRVSVLRIFVLRLSLHVWLQIRTALLCLCRALCAASLLGNAAGPSTQCGVSTLLNDREQRWMCGSSARPSGARFLNAKNPPCHKRDC